MSSYKAPSPIRHLLIGSPEKAERIRKKNEALKKYWDITEPNEQEPEKKRYFSGKWNKSPRLKPEDYKRMNPTMTQAIEIAKQRKKRNLDELTTTEKKDILDPEVGR